MRKIFGVVKGGGAVDFFFSVSQGGGPEFFKSHYIFYAGSETISISCSSTVL